MRHQPEKFEAETDRSGIGLEQEYFSTFKQARAYIREECRWESTISGIVRAPISEGGTVIYMQTGDFAE